MFKILPTPSIANVPASVQEGTYLAVIPQGVKTKRELFSAYMKELKFPGYFNPASWDSFDECLRTLDEIEEASVLIAHEDLPLAAMPNDLLIYLGLLQYSAAFNESYVKRKLIVTFPESVWERIVEGYRELRQRELAKWVTRYDVSAFTFVRPYDGGSIPEDCDLLVEIGSGIRTRKELIAAFPHSTDPWLLPRAVGWLGLEEGLGAVDYQIKHMCLVHDDLPLESDEEDLKCYLDVLLTFRDNRARTGYTKVDVFFPNYAEEQIRRCMLELQTEREHWLNGADLRSD